MTSPASKHRINDLCFRLFVIWIIVVVSSDLSFAQERRRGKCEFLGDIFSLEIPELSIILTMHV